MKHEIKSSVIKNIVDYLNKQYPNNAPHHIVIMDDKQFKRWQNEI